jgi:hypothetical protein
VRPREREAVPLDLRPVLPLAEVRPRDLAPVRRVLRAGFARRELDALFFEERLEVPFVSPALRRCLFVTRAASSSARPVLAPRLRADCLMCWYWRWRFGFFTPRGGIRSSSRCRLDCAANLGMPVSRRSGREEFHADER